MDHQYSTCLLNKQASEEKEGTPLHDSSQLPELSVG